MSLAEALAAVELESTLLRGVRGPRGDDGLQGVEGKAGLQGPPGLDGKDGIDGAPGRDGIDGKDGKRGPIGPQGKQGEKGEPGKDGRDGGVSGGRSYNVRGFASGMVIDNGGTKINDGSVVGEVDFTGAGVSTAMSGGKAVVTIAGGGASPTIRQAAGVPSGAPSGTELPIAFDSTATTGGLYVWSGSAWVLAAPIPPVLTPG